jgi:hypothetical protein
MFRFLEGALARQQGLRACGLVPEMPVEDLLYGELSLETEGFFELVRAGRIVPHRAEIEAFTTDGVLLTNGKKLEADLVIFGTGFRQATPFLDPELTASLTDERGNFLLYRYILPLDLPRLAFVGYNTSFYCPLTSEFASLWLAEHLRGRLRLPDAKEMRRQIDDHLRWRARFRPNGSTSGLCVNPFSLHHLDVLMQDMDVRLPAATRIREWLLPVDPKYYAGIRRKIVARGRASIVRKSKAK